MTKEEKIALIKFLYLNDETRDFLCNDLFQEFKNIIPKTMCLSNENLNDDMRAYNHSCVKLLIQVFFNENINYKELTKKLFSHYTENRLIEHLILGYVFFIANINNKEDIDIFKDKKSICYSEAPPLYNLIL